MEIYLIYLLLLVVGCIVGFTTGALGLGGGFIMVPTLIYIFQNLGISDDHVVAMAVGTSLSVIFLTSLNSAYSHSKFGNIIWKYSLLLGFSGIIGTFAGVRIVTNYISGDIHRMLFGIMLIILSLNMAFNKTNPKIESSQNVNYLPVILCGFLIGVLSSMFGIGGGTIAIPILTLFLKTPIKKSIGTSLGMMVIISLSGFLGYLLSPVEIAGSYKYLNFIGYVSVTSAVSIGVMSLIFSRYGAKISNNINSSVLKKFFGIILMFVGLTMII
uniref:Probable membrane transporter protein n=1 Tax=Methanococcus maripaludis (strain C6 / ATCC BAA-1332) TaxID=444158 RepID=A9AB02_METM6